MHGLFRQRTLFRVMVLLWFEDTLNLIYNQMSISLILIGVISLVVIAGTAYLFITKNEELTQDKKNKILLIVGTVIFISFLVTTFKHRKIGLAPKDADDTTINIKKVFFGNGCNFHHPKDNNHGFEIGEELLSEVYAKNYLSLYDKPAKTEDLKELTKDYQEIIVYLSKKDEGASHFLSSLATKKCRDMRMPVIYLDLDREYRRQSQFLKAIGVSSFQQLENFMCHFSGVEKKQTKFGTEFVRNNRAENSGPYLIIDNFQKLLAALSPADSAQSFDEDGLGQIGESATSTAKDSSKWRLLERILQQLVGRCRVNIILNTEQHWALQELHQIWEQIQQTQHNKNKNRFELHRWQPLNQYSLYKILNKQHPNHDTMVTKLIESNSHSSYTFKQLFSLADDLRSMTQTKQHEVNGKTVRDELQLKEWNIKYNVAKYFGLEQTYRLLKTSPDKKVSILKNKLRFSEIEQLQEIGLLEIADGLVLLK